MKIFHREGFGLVEGDSFVLDLQGGDALDYVHRSSRSTVSCITSDSISPFCPLYQRRLSAQTFQHSLQLNESWNHFYLNLSLSKDWCNV